MVCETEAEYEKQLLAHSHADVLEISECEAIAYYCDYTVLIQYKKDYYHGISST